jgi:hypothetical protein
MDEKDMILMILMAIGSIISMMFFLICIRKFSSSPPDIDGLSINSSKKLKFVNMNSAEKKQFLNSLQNEEEWSDS